MHAAPASAAPSPPRPAGCRLLTWAASAEIIAFDNLLVVYKFVGDLHFYATADGDENEIVLAMVLGALVDTVSTLLACVPTHALPAGPRAPAPVPWACSRRVASPARSSVDKKSALENLDLVFMTLDELVDGGCVPAAA